MNESIAGWENQREIKKKRAGGNGKRGSLGKDRRDQARVENKEKGRVVRVNWEENLTQKRKSDRQGVSEISGIQHCTNGFEMNYQSSKSAVPGQH